MEKSVKNAVFKGFPVLMESGPFWSKQYSQTTNKETNNSLSSYFKEMYLVSKCMSKRVADQSAIGLPLVVHMTYRTQNLSPKLVSGWTWNWTGERCWASVDKTKALLPIPSSFNWRRGTGCGWSWLKGGWWNPIPTRPSQASLVTGKSSH